MKVDKKVVTETKTTLSDLSRDEVLVLLNALFIFSKSEDIALTAKNDDGETQRDTATRMEKVIRELGYR
jgi:hypothetical protein